MFANKHSNDLVAIDFGGAATTQEDLNIYSTDFARTSLLNKIWTSPSATILSEPLDSIVGLIKTIKYIEQKSYFKIMNQKEWSLS